MKWITFPSVNRVNVIVMILQCGMLECFVRNNIEIFCPLIENRISEAGRQTDIQTEERRRREKRNDITYLAP